MEIRPAEAASVSFNIERWTRTGHVPASDEVVAEEPLEIRVRAGDSAAYTTLAVTMRTPGHDVELGIGFLYGEGLITAPTDVVRAQPSESEPNIVEITLGADRDLGLLADARRFYTTSSCGLCGRSSLDAVVAALKGRYVAGDERIGAELLTALPSRLRTRQTVFETTGGLHGCGLFDTTGRLLTVREDVGRHNAVDKVLGRAFLDGVLPASDRILVLSGRAGFELIQKAVMAGVSVVAAVGAPTSLAVELARTADQTLIGFLGANRLNVYASARRLLLDGAAGAWADRPGAGP